MALRGYVLRPRLLELDATPWLNTAAGCGVEAGAAEVKECNHHARTEKAAPMALATASQHGCDNDVHGGRDFVGELR